MSERVGEGSHGVDFRRLYSLVSQMPDSQRGDAINLNIGGRNIQVAYLTEMASVTIQADADMWFVNADGTVDSHAQNNGDLPGGLAEGICRELESRQAPHRIGLDRASVPIPPPRPSTDGLRPDNVGAFFDEIHRTTRASVDEYRTRSAVENYLSYADLSGFGSVLPRDQRYRLDDNIARVKRGELTPSERKYGDTLKQMQDNPSMNEKLREFVPSMLREFNSLMQRMGLDNALNPFSTSESWVYFDIAKQQYLANHREESTPEYHLGLPLEDAQVRTDIVNRHFGWEIHQKWNDSRFHPNIEAVLRRARNQGETSEAMTLLNMKGKPENNTLRSVHLARLGQLIRSML